MRRPVMIMWMSYRVADLASTALCPDGPGTVTAGGDPIRVCLIGNGWGALNHDLAIPGHLVSDPHVLPGKVGEECVSMLALGQRRGP